MGVLVSQLNMTEIIAQCCNTIDLTMVQFAGCSIADELFSSFEQLLTLADRKGVKYDRYAATRTQSTPIYGVPIHGSGKSAELQPLHTWHSD